MAIAEVIARGYGSFGGAWWLPTRGYGDGLQEGGASLCGDVAAVALLSGDVTATALLGGTASSRPLLRGNVTGQPPC